MVTDSLTGNPLKNSVVAAIPLRGFHLKSMRTDSNGHYLLRVEPGTYLLSFSAPRYRSEFYNNQSRLNSAARITVKSGDSLTNYNAALYSNVPDKQVTLKGTVKDSAGNPVQARVRALVLTHRFFQHRFMNATTDTAGGYSIQLRAGDSVIVFAQPVNNQYLPQFYNNKSELFEADKILLNRDTTGIDFTLLKRAVYANGISGRVTAMDSAGNVMGVPASVTAFKLGKVSPERFRSSVLSDSVGNYSLTNLEPGTYIVLAVPERGYIPTFYRSDTTETLSWRQADTLKVTASASLNNINFVVRAVPDSGFGQIAGTVKTTSGSGVGGAVVFFTDVNQNIAGYTVSDAQGNYTMPFLAPGTYGVWVDKVNYNGTSQQNVDLSYTGTQTPSVNLTLTPVTITAVGDNKTAVTSYELAQNYPNPFNPTTTISFQIPQAGLVELKVYNSIGQEVATLVNEFRQAGRYNVSFNAAALSSGIYFYKMTAGSFVQTQKMVLLK
ncbi:MAG: carboxypeptidase regulatory-like domain-containing protein, partial [Syntrophothermus sp.]